MIDFRPQLRQLWHEAGATASGSHEWRARRLTCAAPVVVLAGVRDADGRFSLLIETELTASTEPRFRFRASGISVDDQRRPQEGLRRLAIVLEMEELRDVFETLAADVIEVVSTASTNSEAFSSVTARLEAWQACLNARRGNISVEQQIGFLGELQVLCRLASQIGYSMAVEAWQGPLDGLHDFSLSSTAIEVKSVLGLGHSIRINNVHQLDRTGLQALAIARPRFVQSEVAPNVPEAVEQVRREIEQSAPAILAEFERRVLFAGIVSGCDDLSVRVQLSECRFYRVCGDFPWIDPELLPSAVSAVRYDLNENHIREFQMEEEGIDAHLKSMGGPNSDG